MSDETANGIFTLVVILWAVVIGLSIGIVIGHSLERNRAIEAGVGRWTVDTKTGDTTFVYGVVK